MAPVAIGSTAATGGGGTSAAELFAGARSNGDTNVRWPYVCEAPARAADTQKIAVNSVGIFIAETPVGWDLRTGLATRVPADAFHYKGRPRGRRGRLRR